MRCSVRISIEINLLSIDFPFKSKGSERVSIEINLVSIDFPFKYKFHQPKAKESNKDNASFFQSDSLGFS